MLYREIIAVCSQIHTKHTNTLCGQNVELLNVKLAVHIVTIGLNGEMNCALFRDTISTNALSGTAMKLAAEPVTVSLSPKRAPEIRTIGTDCRAQLEPQLFRKCPAFQGRGRSLNAVTNSHLHLTVLYIRSVSF